MTLQVQIKQIQTNQA